MAKKRLSTGIPREWTPHTAEVIEDELTRMYSLLPAGTPTAGPGGGAPGLHAPTHAAGGTDPVQLDESQITGLGTDLAARVLTTDPRLSDARTPAAHAASHAAGGTDAVTLTEAQITNLPGDLTALAAATAAVNAAAEHVANKNVANGYAGLDAGSKLTGSQQKYGTAANTAAEGNDARLSDARTPTAHEASHLAAGSDPIAGLSPSQITGTAVVTGDSRLSDARTPTAHAASHAINGSDPLANSPLVADRTYYVRTDGNNANSGLVDSAGGAFLTIQKAIDVAVTINLGLFNITIQVRTGTFAPITLKTFRGNGQIILQGDTVTPANVIINNTTAGTHCVTHNTGVRSPWKITGFKLTNSGTGNSDGISMSDSVLELGVMEFGAITRYGVLVATMGACKSSGAITWSGNIARAIFVQSLGLVAQIGAGATWTYSGTPAWGGAFAYLTSGGQISVFSTQTGAATGKRYQVESNAVLNVFGAGINFFPGNVAGTTATGGVLA
jgi:hypothetical protein